MERILYKPDPDEKDKLRWQDDGYTLPDEEDEKQEEGSNPKTNLDSDDE